MITTKMTEYPSNFNFCFKGKLIGVNKWHIPIRIGKRIGMTLTKEYRHFVNLLAGSIRYPEPFDDAVDIKIDLYMPGTKDTDSPIKPIIDAIQKSGLIKNDNLVCDITINRYFSTREGEGFALRIMESKKTKADIPI